MSRPDVAPSVRAGALLGIGLMAGLDEIVFHQLLAWHHLYDRGSTSAGLVADGVLHLVELVLYLVGAWLAVRLVRERTVRWDGLAAGVVTGAGGFQLFDGLVNHKVLRLHQIRYGVDPTPYDVTWNVAAVAMVFLGLWLLRRATRRTP